MTDPIQRIPYRNSAAYKAAELLYQTGPKTESDLFSSVGFGYREYIRRGRLREAIDEGWLRHLPDYMVDLTEFARAHFDEQPPEARRMGKVAEPRSINLMDRKPYQPPKRLPRGDEPEWAKRSDVTFHKG